MVLLVKTVVDSEDPKGDNADKKPLFSKEQHPHTAEYHREQWSFVTDTTLRENIAYQMQYLEFLVALYNNYRIYLTVESLLCKDIITTVGGVVEAALFDVIQTARKGAGMPMSERTDMAALLGEAYHSFRFIDKDTWHYFHDLRRLRNNVHLKAADFREHMAYAVEDGNEAISRLESFRLAFTDV